MHVQLTRNQGVEVRIPVFYVSSSPFCDPYPCVVPPSITAPPTELNSTDIPVCCGGVQLNLANSDNPIDVRVLVDGTLHPANQVVRNGSFLYIMGLQAGTEYSLRIALSNIFRTAQFSTTVRPLLGELVCTATYT